MRSWDAIIVGGGIIGLSLAVELHKRNLRALVVDRGEPGHEASSAAAGMLADSDFPPSSPIALLASASARMYPEFVHELEDESKMDCDLRDQGTLLFHSHPPANGARSLSAEELAQIEPALSGHLQSVFYIKERCVDPRKLTAAALQAVKHREIDISSGSEVIEIVLEGGRASGVRTKQTTYGAAIVINCAGAWAGQIGPQPFPIRPMKGQLVSVVGVKLEHVIRTPEIYLVPRSNGSIVIGSTVEDVGFDKRTDPSTIQRLHAAAIDLVPALKQARIHEAWAGLRPGTPDGLPIMGGTEVPGYFVASGHFRDGILLAPITARLMSQLITGEKPDQDLSPFSARRFAKKKPLQISQ